MSPTNKSDKSTTARRCNSEIQYFRDEHERLKTMADKEVSKLHTPPHKPYVPYVYNSLEPYMDVTLFGSTLAKPYEARPGSSVSRKTSFGLCDPWVSYEMDSTVTQRKSARRSTDCHNSRESKSPRSGRCTSRDDGTKVPMFPTVVVTRNDLCGKTLYYSDVPRIREELKKSYSDSADRRIEQQYKQTKTEFYRRQLDRMADYHPDSRPRMRAAYFSYLQNSTGSRKAVYECVHDVEKAERKERQDEAKKSTASSDKKKPQTQASSKTVAVC